MADEQKYFFLNLTAQGIKGGSQKAGHIDWLELDSWSFNMTQESEMNVGTGRPDKSTVAGTFGFTVKHMGPGLFKLAAKAGFIETPIVFEAERSGLQAGGGQGTTMVYLQLTFNRAVISNRSLSGDTGRKTEQIHFSFEQVNVVYKPVINGMVGPACTANYDMKSAALTQS